MKQRTAVKSYALRSTTARLGALKRSVEEVTTILIARSTGSVLVCQPGLPRAFALPLTWQRTSLIGCGRFTNWWSRLRGGIV